MFKKLFVLLVFGLIFYSLFLIVVPHYNHFAFKSDLKEMLRVSVTDRPEEVMIKIMNLVEQHKIPVTQEQINLEQKGWYVVKTSWKETVDFFTIYQKTFEFHIDTSMGEVSRH